MKEQIAVLKELQEVVLIRDEYYQTGDGSRMGEFNAKIDELKSKLSPQVRTIFERLYKRNHVAAAGLSNNCCAACGMTVPIANVQMVMQGRNLVCCSSCGRILYAADGDSVQNRAGRVDQEGKVGLERFSNAKLVIPNLKATERTEAIAELAELLEKNGAIDSADNVIAAAMAREEILSTATDHDVAFPHVRGVEGGGLTVAVGVSKQGIQWDGVKVHIVFLAMIPVAVSAYYLRFMSAVTKSFGKANVRDLVLAAEDAQTLWRLVQKHTRTELK